MAYVFTSCGGLVLCNIIILLAGATPISLASCLVILGVALYAWQRRDLKSERRLYEEPLAASQDAGTWEQIEDSMRWSFLPSTGVLRANSRRSVPTTNENLTTLRCLVLHRPTHEPSLNTSGDYPYGWHFHGRKRLWEVRVQARFKHLPTGPIYFGLELLGGGGHTTGFAKQVKNALLALIRRTMGDEFYQSPGDDAATTEGEAEPPTFAMPLWAVDQFIISEAGQEPDLTADLTGLGTRRTDGIKAYVGAVRRMLDELSTEKVYTFCFWGVSQFVDIVNWEMRGVFPGFKMDASKLCGGAPVYVAAYQLMDGPMEDKEDRRHLVSRKKYYFKIAVWNELQPPAPEVLSQLLGTEVPKRDSASAEGARATPKSRLADAWARLRARARARRKLRLQLFRDAFGECAGWSPSMARRGEMPREVPVAKI